MSLFDDLWRAGVLRTLDHAFAQSLRRLDPGTRDEDMLNLALWLKRNDFRLDQVQNFLPTPMALATTMYHSERNPLQKVGRGAARVGTVRGGRQRKLHKAFLRYHDPENWPLLREALQAMGRADLIGTRIDRHLPVTP